MDDDPQRHRSALQKWGPVGAAVAAFVAAGYEVVKASEEGLHSTLAAGFFTIGMVSFGFWLRGIAHDDNEK